MILLIDNYDSFTYNLYQYLGELGADVEVRRNDEITVEAINILNPEAIVLSPGPGHPKDAGICIEVVQSLYKEIPILGICLGHQAIGEAFSATVSQAQVIKHGKTSNVQHKGKGLFEYLSISLEVMRYHSLIIEKVTLPNEFEVTATSMDDKEIMAIQHRKYPLFGLQFHPESIGTGDGKAMLKNFLTIVRKEQVKNENLSSEVSK
ncbi:anthranilate synthase/aminodeoxychorismate synthase-like glutamine amidotransferase [Salirhabdus euzebyi]|uniref:Anthranilate synthase/aminodeoxychorismate synthase-like glutamine amidotransferase n=1 Tax=Salirhabdus euzebyi TaxID=394506 RepID=A0A841Q8Z0_9BACI|nr:aminodeoxychorismate/anthranilate synthase component II [Salirhabdus euzebyi]MBB6455119.1 anthranilate synthase/aminodeoxychorismate synthase-like glutamine amidotransferase [Salirhabdus euzebyi]